MLSERTSYQCLQEQPACNHKKRRDFKRNTIARDRCTPLSNALSVCEWLMVEAKQSDYLKIFYCLTISRNESFKCSLEFGHIIKFEWMPDPEIRNYGKRERERDRQTKNYYQFFFFVFFFAFTFNSFLILVEFFIMILWVTHVIN